MAKPLSRKSQLLREAIRKFPALGNTVLAEKLNEKPEREQDRLRFTAQDVSAQRIALRKMETTAPGPAFEEEPAPARHEENGGLTADDLRQLMGLVRKAGGTGRLVEVLEVIRSVSE